MSRELFGIIRSALYTTAMVALSLLAMYLMMYQPSTKGADIGSPIPIPREFERDTPQVNLLSNYRSPVGHTHTCRNGHSWDHTSNPTHNCLICGEPQYTIDPVPRLVPTTSSTALKYSLPTSTSGCGPGGCPTTPRWRLLR